MADQEERGGSQGQRMFERPELKGTGGPARPTIQKRKPVGKNKGDKPTRAASL